MEKKWEFPQLSLEERDRRWRGIRSAMVKRRLDCLLIYADSGHWHSYSADMRYVTQIGHPGDEGIVVFPREGDVTVCPNFGNQHREYRINMQNWVKDVREGWQKGQDPTSLAIKRVKELGLESRPIGVTGLGGLSAPEGRMPHGTFLRIQKAFPNLVNASDILEEMRLIKSEEEIKFIEKAVEISDQVIDTIIEKARPGMRGYELYAWAMHTLYSNGSEPPMFLFDHGPAPWHSNPLPDWRAIQKGDVILTVISPRYGGYYGHAHQCFALGEPRKEFYDLFEKALESFKKGLAVLRPGITVQEATDVFVEPVKKAGYYWSNPPFHGLGLKMPDYPMSGLAGMDKSYHGDIIIEEGMVFALEGTAQMLDEAMGVSIGNAAVITATGVRYLSKRKPEFIIIKPK